MTTGFTAASTLTWAKTVVDIRVAATGHTTAGTYGKALHERLTYLDTVLAG